ncbi:glycosyltransferase, partial [Kineococcus glutinatus]|uniref:glycosyltransferase n=1 Tax=Kineococcus glutinatus TaxID=1070872 RepID=UPI0031F077AD
GYWDDDFGAARNRALQHCTGRWVFSVDADEVVDGDPRLLRRHLHGTTADCLNVVVSSDSWDGVEGAVRFELPRLFRRSRCRWEGPLHEQLVTSGPPLSFASAPGVSLRHSGYTPLRYQQRGKGERNLVLARKALADARARNSPDLTRHLVDAARSALSGGSAHEAVELFAEIDRAAMNARHGIIAAHPAIRAALAVDDLAAAREWLAALERWGETPAVCRGLEAQVALAAG